MSIVDELPGLVVVHDEKGIGRISSADDSRVTVDMWLPHHRHPFSPSGEFQRMLLENITDLDKSISWGFITSAFLDSPKWSVALAGSELDDSILSIRCADSNVVIHTSNPPRPFEYAEVMEEQLCLNLERESDQYDPDLMSSISGTIDLVDWSLSWFLIRKRESDQEYHQRLAALRSNLDGRCFSDYVFPYLPDQVKCRLVHHVSAIVATKYLQLGHEPALSMVETAINDRARSNSGIINGFARSYNERWLHSRMNGRGTYVSQRDRIRGR